MASDLRIETPVDGATLVGPFDAHMVQQVHQEGVPPTGAAFGQFASTPSGPWTYCREDAGPIRTQHPNGYPWTSQGPSEWDFPGFEIVADAYFRVVLHDSEGGAQFLESDPKHYHKRTVGMGEGL